MNTKLVKIELQEIDSTNDFAHRFIESNEYNSSEEYLITAEYQSNGRGTGKNIWQSNKSQNLLFSLIISPNLEPKDQFIISKIISLTIIDLLGVYKVNAKIKWPNDILVNRKKIAGILIENSVVGNLIKNSVIGIGLNVNQLDFEMDLKATSLAVLKEKIFDIQTVLNDFVLYYQKWQQLCKENKEIIDQEYFNNLLGKDEYFEYKFKQDYFDAKVCKIDEYGRLVLIDKNGVSQTFSFKEVEMIY